MARRRIVPATPPVQRKRGRKPRAPRNILITFFKAEGSIRSLAAQIYGGYHDGDGARYTKRKRKYAELQREYPPGYPNSPGVWTSIESGRLGRVNFQGYRSVEDLFAELNITLALNFKEKFRERIESYRAKKGGKLIRKKVRVPFVKRYKRADDARDVYPNGSWKWQVLEVPMVPAKRMKEFRATEASKPRIIESASGKMGRR